MNERLGEIAYNTYCDTRNWKSFNGKALPSWIGVREDVKIGWIKAAEAVASEVKEGLL